MLVAVLMAMPLGAQMASDSSEPMRIVPGVTPPRLIHKVDPEYSPGARADNVQGTVVLQIVIDKKDRAADISIVSPLGFGLDERAQEAVAQWEFVPGMKAGAPVKVLAAVEVNFRFPELWFGEKMERRRAAFNVALRTLDRPGASPAAVERAVQSIMDLCRRVSQRLCISPDYGESTVNTVRRTRQRASI